MTNHRRWILAVLLLSCFVVGLAEACSDNTPSTPSSPPPPPVNTPPTVQSVTASAARVDAGGQINLTAVVTDAETPIDQLTYQWSASPANGTFSGTGRQVTWHAPAGPPTPAVYTVTLTVIENYVVNGRAAQNTATGSVSVHYNDSDAEITGLSMQFLKDFTTYDVSPAACVRNFSDSCPGKAAELSDITLNRQDFHILSGDYSVQQISYNADRTFANITAPCTFYDIPVATNKEEKVQGICLLTSTYENWQWFLCDSHFQGISTTPYTLMGRALMRGRLQ